MKLLIRNLIWFVIPLLILTVIGLFLPATPRASKSLLFAILQKDSLLKSAESPRIIFVGSSNLSFGLNSQMIKDSLKMNPINTGIHGAISTKFTIDNTIQYVKNGDIVVLITPYQHLYDRYSFGSPELLRTIFDVDLSYIKLLNAGQMLNLVQYIPKYSLSKFKPKEYLDKKESILYGIHSFNKYGDVYTHWGMKGSEVPSITIAGKLNPKVINGIKEFEIQVRKKNAILFLSYPALQRESYLNSVEQLQKAESEYIRSGFKVIGSPERYVVPDSMLFDTPMHLKKNGVDYYTKLFLEDFKKVTTHE